VTQAAATGAALHRIQEQSYSSAGHGIRSSWPREQAMSADELGGFLGVGRADWAVAWFQLGPERVFSYAGA
jgi:hypothetical protein